MSFSFACKTRAVAGDDFLKWKSGGTIGSWHHFIKTLNLYTDVIYSLLNWTKQRRPARGEETTVQPVCVQEKDRQTDGEREREGVNFQACCLYSPISQPQGARFPMSGRARN